MVLFPSYPGDQEIKSSTRVVALPCFVRREGPHNTFVSVAIDYVMLVSDITYCSELYSTVESGCFLHVSSYPA